MIEIELGQLAHSDGYWSNLKKLLLVFFRNNYKVIENELCQIV